MKELGGVCTALCSLCLAVSILSALIPQRRTAKVFTFAVGLFIISSVSGVIGRSDLLSSDVDDLCQYEYEDVLHYERDFTDEAVRLTADNTVAALNDILLNEGIRAEDIRLSLKISDEGRIYASRIVIYISEEYASCVNSIKSIVCGNMSKEPEIYVTGR